MTWLDVEGIRDYSQYPNSLRTITAEGASPEEEGICLSEREASVHRLGGAEKTVHVPTFNNWPRRP